MVKVYEYKIQILEHHLDTMGHVNNATYLQLFEQARWEMLEVNDYGIAIIKKIRIAPILLDLDCSFKRELVNRESINIVSSFIAPKNRLVSRFNQKMYNENHDLCSEINISIGLMHLDSRKLILPTKLWKNIIEQ